VLLRNTETGVETRTTTNEQGVYVILHILPGSYTLEASKEGFATSRLGVLLGLEAIRMLSESRVAVGVLVAPVIPGLTDHEMPAILRAAADAGARFAGYVPLRLPYAVKELFERWLEDHFPDRKQKVLGRIRDLRGGKLNDPRFGSRLRGEGVFAEEIRALFTIACRRAGIAEGRTELSAAAFRRPGAAQLALW
jgi:hypothetical protein